MEARAAMDLGLLQMEDTLDRWDTILETVGFKALINLQLVHRIRRHCISQIIDFNLLSLKL